MAGLLKIYRVLLGSLTAAALLSAAPTPKPAGGKYEATAYSVTGVTSSGQYTHRHVVAADPDVLPIGSRIRIRRAGKYSGEYVVADTGRKIVGRKLDIYMPNTKECQKFGRRPVRVKVLEVGEGTRRDAAEADATVKQNVAHDIRQGTVGSAATEQDWSTKGSTRKAEALATAPVGTPVDVSASQKASPSPRQ